MSNIITFYSYKGGVGRTMSLANTAVLLATWGHKVLMIDWDLEAPGLEHFFEQFIDIELVKSKGGIIDLLGNKEKINWQDTLIPVYIPAVRQPIHFISSGRRNEDYFANVRKFDIDAFYQENGGHLIEMLRNEWKDAYDFILIDSRTGVTEIGGICTVQLPDQVVLLFTSTEQGFRGTLDIANRAKKAQQKLPYEREKLVFIPVLTKFDTQTEFKLSQMWLSRFSDDLENIYNDWLPISLKRKEFLELTKIPYVSYFSYGEKLPVLEQSSNDTTGLAYAYENLAALIANNLNDVISLIYARERYVNPVNRDYLLPETLSGNLKIFISSSHKDRAVKDHLLSYLSVLGVKYNVDILSDNMISPGIKIDQHIDKSLSQADIFIPLISQDFFASNWTQYELKKAIESNKIVLPILIKNAFWQDSAIKNHQIIPRDLQPLADKINPEEAFSQVLAEIENVVLKTITIPKFKIAIITFMVEELAAVTDCFELNGSLKQLKSDHANRTYFTGHLYDKRGNAVNVVSTMILNQNGSSFTRIYESLNEEFNPQLLIVLNRSAGVNNRVKIGDVVIANQILALTKIKTSENLQRPSSIEIGETGLNLVAMFQHSHKSSSPQFTDDTQSEYQVLTGGVGISNLVAKSNNDVRLHNRKLFAVTTGLDFRDIESLNKSLYNSGKKTDILLVVQIVDLLNGGKAKNQSSFKNGMNVIAELVKANYWD